mmetsp:Transcript_48023/g.112150  ORF Transcript_48023/g.112150 Transcript_48023/m.112150 type:complete len:1008 (-) Transcript_48023:57-3080(-)
MLGDNLLSQVVNPLDDVVLDEELDFSTSLILEPPDLWNLTRASSSTAQAYLLDWAYDNEALAILLGVVVFWTLGVMLFSCVVPEELKYEPIQVSEVLQRYGPMGCFKYLHYILFLPLHLLRSMETASGDRQVSSSSERSYLEETRHVFNATVADFLAVRRSMIYVAGLFSLLALYIAMGDIVDAWDMLHSWQKWADVEIDDHPMSFKQYVQNCTELHWNEQQLRIAPEAWMAYTQKMMGGVLGKLMLQTGAVDMFASFLRIACLFTSCCMLWWSLKHWSQFHLSRRTVMLGWLVTFLAPFLITLVPTRLFISWEKVNPVVETYAHELSEHLAGTTTDKVKVQCQQMIDFAESGTVEGFERRIQQICTIMRRTPNRHVKCCAIFDVVDFDFRPVHKSCKLIRQYLDDPSGAAHKRAMDESIRLCRDVIIPHAATKIRMGLGDTLTFISAVSPMVPTLFAFINGLKGFQTIMPAALALAPALLRGALKVKVLTPQSTIPGMFIILLPWLYCPMSWGLYHVAYQVTGDSWMLFGLLVFAFSPMCYFAYGSFSNITRPLTDAQVQEVLQGMSRWSLVVSIISYCMLGKFVHHRYHDMVGRELTVEEDMVMKIVNKVPVLQFEFWFHMIVAAAANYFFTTLAGIDWMMCEIGEQRHYETLLDIASRLDELEGIEDSSNYPDGMRSAHERAHLKEVAQQRQHRLDCVEWIIFNEAPMRVVETSFCVTGSSIAGPSESSQGGSGLSSRRTRKTLTTYKELEMVTPGSGSSAPSNSVSSKDVVDLTAGADSDDDAPQQTQRKDEDPYDSELWGDLVSPPLHFVEPTNDTKQRTGAKFSQRSVPGLPRSAPKDAQQRPPPRPPNVVQQQQVRPQRSLFQSMLSAITPSIAPQAPIPPRPPHQPAYHPQSAPCYSAASAQQGHGSGAMQPASQFPQQPCWGPSSAGAAPVQQWGSVPQGYSQPSPQFQGHYAGAAWRPGMQPPAYPRPHSGRPPNGAFPFSPGGVPGSGCPHSQGFR